MLEGKTAFITGANRGIGKAILEEFAKNRANIIAHARKETPEFQDLTLSIAKQHGVAVTPVFFDMTDSDAMKNAIRGLIASKIPVDILVNNAGVGHFGLFQMTSMQKIKEIFNINLFAQLELTQLLLRYMGRRQNSCIINMGSTMGFNLPKGSCAYGLSKAAFMAFTQMLAAECGSFGIRVNALAPGLVETEMVDQMGSNARSIMTEFSALQRLGRPEEIARVAVFVASDRASYLNGQCIRLDGGKA